MSGVSTTYIPVMKPVLETVVRSSPAVCRRVAAGEQQAEERPRREPGPAERAHAPRARNRERRSRDREADGEEREERIERDRVLDLDEGHAPDRGHGDQREQRHRAILSYNDEGDSSGAFVTSLLQPS